jgi:prephenate dehydratase/chorismate mutase/prephenate dehydratase
VRETEIERLRRRIDLIDWRILQLLNERMEIALKVRKHKQGVFDPERERTVLENVRQASRNLITEHFSQAIFGTIMEESKRLQEAPITLIGFQGEHGAFSEVAALSYHRNLVPIPCREFKDVFEEVENGALDYGIVPVENSLEGQIAEVNDLLIETPLNVVGEVVIPIHHCLLTLPETNYRELKVVYSHPQALAQCRQFIKRHRLEPRPFYDTAGAAKMLSQERPEASAVIASRLCAELYRLEIIKENIEDHPSNVTRFVVLSRTGRGEGNKCSIVFSVAHRPGALFEVLRVFYERHLNLTRIESRPEKGNPGRYVFFADFEGNSGDERVSSVLDEVRSRTLTFKLLGFYKAFREVSP